MILRCLRHSSMVGSTASNLARKSAGWFTAPFQKAYTFLS